MMATAGAHAFCDGDEKKKFWQKEKKHGPGDTIGQGVRMEVWKARHGNVTALDMEDGYEPYHLLLTRLRSTECEPAEFVHLIDALSHMLLAYAVGTLPTEEVEVQTHSNVAYSGIRHERPLCCVSIMPAGDCMLKCMRDLVPNVQYGKLLLQRDPANLDGPPAAVYSKLPKGIESQQVVVVDPMVATGSTAVAAIHLLKKAGVPEERITFVNLVAAPEGIERLSSAFPDMQIITAALDAGLSNDHFIVPGLGNFGDRYYGHNIYPYHDKGVGGH